MKNLIIFLVILAYLFAGCKNKHSNNQNYQHTEVEDQHTHTQEEGETDHSHAAAEDQQTHTHEGDEADHSRPAAEDQQTHIHEGDETDPSHPAAEDQHTHTAGDAADLGSLVFTVYSDKTELFVEFSPLVEGEPTELVAHFTKLENFKPLTNVNLRVILSGENISEEVEIKEQLTPGIFLPVISPDACGQCNLIFEIFSKGYTDRIEIENVIVFHDDTEALEALEEKQVGNYVSFLKENSWKIDFAHEKILKKDFYNVIKATGEILPAQGDNIVVSANTNGIVLFGEQTLLSGIKVNNGEKLLNISSGKLTENNLITKYEEAKAKYEKSKTDYERALQLVDNKAISQKDFIEAETEYKISKSVFNILSQNYSEGKQGVFSPASGFIKNIFVKEGEYVEAGQALAIIAQNKRLIVKADVIQKHISSLSNITSANFKLPYQNKVYSLEELNGTYISYGKNIVQDGYFIPVYFEIDGNQNVIPGSFVEVLLKESPLKDVIVIPNSAIIEEQGFYYVYVQIEGESFEKREIKQGNSDGKNVHIISGLNENERIVIKGAYRIRLASLSGALPDHGHVH